MKKIILQLTCAIFLMVSNSALADCHVFFEGKTDKGKEVSACSLNNEVFLKIGSPNSTPDLYIQSKESDVLYVEADTFINDMSASIYSFFIPSNGKWYGISFGRHKNSNYSTSVVIGENLDKTNFYNMAKVESSDPIIRKSVAANINFSQFTRMEEPKGEKEYENYLLSFYNVAGFPISK